MTVPSMGRYEPARCDAPQLIRSESKRSIMRQRQKISLAEWFTRGITIAVFILKRGCNRVKCRLSAQWWRGLSKLGSECPATVIFPHPH